MCNNNYRIYVVSVYNTFSEDVHNLLCGEIFSLDELNEGWLPHTIYAPIIKRKLICYNRGMFFILHTSSDLHAVVDVSINNIIHSYYPEKLYFGEAVLSKYTKDLITHLLREDDEYNTK